MLLTPFIVSLPFSRYKFFHRLVGSFHDGLFYEPVSGGIVISKKVTFPRWWLELIGPKNAGIAETHLRVESAAKHGEMTAEEGSGAFLLGAAGVAVVAVVAALFGAAVGRAVGSRKEHKYEAIF